MLCMVVTSAGQSSSNCLISTIQIKLIESDYLKEGQAWVESEVDRFIPAQRFQVSKAGIQTEKFEVELWIEW